MLSAIPSVVIGGSYQPSTPAIAPPGEVNFSEMLLQGLSQVSGLNQQASQQVEQALLGQDTSLAETLTTLKEADLALRLALQVRNKLLDAWQEIQNLRF